MRKTKKFKARYHELNSRSLTVRSSRKVVNPLSAAVLAGTILLGTPVMADVLNAPIIVKEGETTSIIGQEISDYVHTWTDKDLDTPTGTSQIIKAEGAIINNSGTITAIENSKFNNNNINMNINNTTNKYPFYNVYGGAIYNNGEISSIKNSEFSNNNLTFEATGPNVGLKVYGGLIYNENLIKEISNVKFDNNTISLTNNERQPILYGGILSNTGEIQTLNADMTNNTISHEKPVGWSHIMQAGLLYNSGTIGKLSGVYANNKSINNCPDAGYNNTAGLIMNDTGGNIDEVSLIFSDNYLSVENKQTLEANLYTEIIGAMFFSQSNTNINTLDAILNNNKSIVSTDNYATGNMGMLRFNGDVDKITIEATNNSLTTNASKGYSLARGGVLDIIRGHIQNINGKYNSNTLISNQVSGDANIDFVTGAGGAISISTEAIVDEISGIFTNNFVKSSSKQSTKTIADGGAISIDSDTVVNRVKDSLFSNNKVYVESKNGITTAQGGAVYNTGNLEKFKIAILWVTQ